ncbi:MoaD/ThiS family protein [Desulfococcus sp.]|uniref:MoaD/ThiS family protein n=1 Tax=Desulfococcus sp. TaxID=2025834 RepID=UPI0035930EFE
MNATISLKLFATLANRMPPDSDRYPIAPGTTVQDIVSRLDIREGEAKLIFVNNKRALLASVLSDGDRLGIFPPVGGG